MQWWMEPGWKTRLRQRTEADGRSLREISLSAGLNRNYLFDVLSAEREPSIDKLLKICAVLRVSPAWLITGLELSESAEEWLTVMSRLPEPQQSAMIQMILSLDPDKPRQS